MRSMSVQSASSPYAAAAIDQPSAKDRLPKDGGKPLADGQPRPMRQASIDIYRGLVMFLMMAEVLELMHLADAYPDSSWAKWLRFHTTHVQWVGLSLHDMIQPSFSFLVGVSLPFSILARKVARAIVRIDGVARCVEKRRLSAARYLAA
ncbi:MAG: hypothetical protein R3C56_17075 [Pirellulaceae bacterium]